MKEITLTQGKVALVDDKDFEFLNQWRWYAKLNTSIYYAARNTGKFPNRKTLFMEHALLGNQKLDHRDGNGLNNQRANLRIATQSQNGANRDYHKPKGSSRYRGVSWHKASRKWSASIKVNWKAMHLGLFGSELAAALSYNFAASKHFGEFARLNPV